MNFIKTTFRVIFAAIVGLGMSMSLTSCDKVEEVVPTINEVLSFVDAQLIEETLPEVSGNEDNQPVITSITHNSSVIAGGTNLFTLNFEDPNDDAMHLLIAMEGEDGYYRVDVEGGANNIDLTMILDQAHIEDALALFFHLMDERNNVSEPYKVPMNRVEAGTGNLQVHLSWAVDNDIDIHLIQPDGEEIYYNNTTSSTGGHLDVDSNAGCDIDGIRNENITYGEGSVVLAGEYIVEVDYYQECQTDGEVTPYSVIAHLEGEMLTPTSGRNIANGDFLTGTDNRNNPDGRVEVMRFNVPAQIGKKDLIVIDYDYTARERAKLNRSDDKK